MPAYKAIKINGNLNLMHVSYAFYFSSAHHAFSEVIETPSFQEYNVIVNLEWTRIFLSTYVIQYY